MMEIGNWISADQYSGRIVQFPNAKVVGNAVFNYTQNFEYLWDEVQLNITYDSNLSAATEILTSAGRKYTEDFLKGAQEQLEQMRRYFLVANFELEPQVFIKVTTNWVGLTMRYVVAPKKRRAASSFLYREVLHEIQQRNDITMGTDTMEVTVRPSEQLPHQEEDAA
jgi:small-conductance mechanosensitive channel